MKNILQWAKTNPIALASVVVAFLSVVFIAYIVFLRGAGKMDEIVETAQADLRQMSTLQRTTITYPAGDPNAPPQEVLGVANENVISTLRGLYDTLKEEFDEVLSNAEQINRGNRPESLIVEGMLPNPSSSAVRIEARDRYIPVLESMLGTGPLVSPESPWPELEAGLPLTPQAVKDKLDLNRANQIASSGSTVRPDVYAQYQENQRKTYLSAMYDHALGMQIYVESLNPQEAGFPFEAPAWVGLVTAPSDAEIWEGQLRVWILADLVRAIRETNIRAAAALPKDNVDTPEVNEAVPPAPFSLPVKRLIKAEVVSGYVGLNSLGAMMATDGTSGVRAAIPAEQGDAPKKPIPGSNDRAVPDNFYFGPAGRASNALYDVRHARLIVHVEFQRLPMLFEQLAATNLMTVLSVELRDVDEFELFKQGYLYGEQDTVEVEMVIETIWMRQWTVALMPKAVRTYLGVNAAQSQAADAALQQREARGRTGG